MEADAPFGSAGPGILDRAVIALTSALPDNWLGQRLAILFRRITTMRLGYPDGALDVMRWGMRLRLHPRDNGCEKNLLFTPQMYEPTERAVLAAEIDRAKSQSREFVFIDIGANVGLFSFFVAAHSSGAVRIVAVEPEPGNFARLTFNLRANPAVRMQPLALALGEQAGEGVIEMDARDRGGTSVKPLSQSSGARRVAMRPLLDVVREQKLERIDAIKIDVEGAEDRVLAPFFRDAPPALWPRLVLIEDTHESWGTDLFGLLAERGFEVAARTKLNVMLLRK